MRLLSRKTNQKPGLIFIILATVICLLTSFQTCDDKASKFEFINDILDEPKNLQKYLDNKKFRADPFKKSYLTNESSKDSLFQKLNEGIKTNFKKNYSLFCNREKKEYNTKSGVVDMIHEIIILSSNNIDMLKFRWVLLYGRWHLQDIYFTQNEYCK